MDPVAAKYIGAGIACIGMGGAGVGVGIIFGNYLAAALRNRCRWQRRAAGGACRAPICDDGSHHLGVRSQDVEAAKGE